MEKEQLNNKKLNEAIEILQEMARVDSKIGWERLSKDLKTPKRITKTKFFSLSAAAMALLFTSISIFELYQRGSENLIDVDYKTEVITGPILIFQDGSQINLLGGNSMTKSENLDGIVVDTITRHVTYQLDSSSTEQIVDYNTLVTPNNTAFILTLSDGTKVWLNGSTKLRFPHKFRADKREVFLEGEAYFEVVKNPKSPFIVTAGTQRTEVLGTSFNIEAYPETDIISTTLLSGSVRLSNDQSSVVLMPDEQSRLLNGNSGFNVEAVDAEKTIAWTRGYFVCDGLKLNSILMKLERWYGIDIEYNDNIVNQLEFQGNIPRYKNIKDVLTIIENSCELEFIYKNNKIQIK